MAERNAYSLRDEEGYRRPRYPSAALAVRAAIRAQRRIGGQVSVVWCNRDGVPKMTVAHVTDNGTERTKFWPDTEP